MPDVLCITDCSASEKVQFSATFLSKGTVPVILEDPFESKKKQEPPCERKLFFLMKNITNIISALFPLLPASACIAEAPGDIGTDVCSSAVNKRYNYFVVF